MTIRDIRKNTGLTQKEFAELYHISLPTLRRWEQDVNKAPVYLVELLKAVTHYGDDSPSAFEGEESKYYYDAVSCTVQNTCGDCIRITDSILDVKKENIGLYLDELFEDIDLAKKKFSDSCEEDKRSDIIWQKP